MLTVILAAVWVPRQREADPHCFNRVFTFDADSLELPCASLAGSGDTLELPGSRCAVVGRCSACAVLISVCSRL